MKLFRMINVSLPAIFMMLLTRCFNTKPSGEPGPDEGGSMADRAVDSSKGDREETTVEDTPKTAPPEFKLPGSNTAENCEQDGSRVMTEKVSEGGEELETDVFIYGTKQSALLALKLRKYQYNDLTDIYISDSGGNLIAQKGISEISDVTESRNLKIQYFDNLWLEGVSSLVFLFRTMEGKFLKKSMQSEPVFTDHFRGLKVYNLNATLFENVDYYDRHVGNNFAPDEKPFTFEKDPEIALQAPFDAKFYVNEGWAETVITDLSGEVVAEHGENISDLSKSTVFIAYRLMNRKYYFRTFIRVG